jgi:hypothetical protein
MVFYDVLFFYWEGCWVGLMFFWLRGAQAGSEVPRSTRRVLGGSSCTIFLQRCSKHSPSRDRAASPRARAALPVASCAAAGVRPR